jgi:hypothetical protein
MNELARNPRIDCRQIPASTDKDIEVATSQPVPVATPPRGLNQRLASVRREKYLRLAHLLRPDLQELIAVKHCGVRLALEGEIERVDARGEDSDRARQSFVSVFWRSSVRGLGPPAPSHSCGRDGRRLPRGSNRASRLLDQLSLLKPDLFALRVARPSARTRGRSATRGTSVCGSERAVPCDATVAGTQGWSRLAVVSLDIIVPIKSAQLGTSQPRFGTSSNVLNVR